MARQAVGMLSSMVGRVGSFKKMLATSREFSDFVHVPIFTINIKYLKHPYPMYRINSLLTLLLALSSASASAVVYEQDFGNSTGTFNTASSNSTDFIPSTQPGGGEQYVRIGSGDGSWVLQPSTLSSGSGSELLATASSSSSRNKFAIYDFLDSTSLYQMSFDVEFSGGTDGSWNFVFGNGDGGDNDFAKTGSAISAAETFANIVFQFDAGSGMTAFSNGTELLSDPFSQDIEYRVEIYANNSTSDATYNGGVNTVVAGSYDLWVDGLLVGGNLPKSSLANGIAIDSFTFWGQDSTGNGAAITLDNITYSTAIPEPHVICLPVAICLFICFRQVRRKPSNLEL
ncbi:hypothetical protein ACFFOV_16125 [Cerasicoccus arenae]